MGILRNRETSSHDFRDTLRTITVLIGGEVFKNLPLTSKKIWTPLSETEVPEIKRIPCIVPILRAGLSMQDAMWTLIPNMASYDIGLRRVEDDSPNVKIEEYLNKLPKALDPKTPVIMLDPMIATGESACHAINLVKATGAQNITYMAILSCDQGLRKIQESHSDVKIFCAAIDPELGKNNYIFPGLGDAGDRYKNTK